MKLLRDDFNCFKILEKGQISPRNYQYIKLLWTFDVKFDGRKRARCNAGGHMTEPLPQEETYSSVVALDTVRLAFVAAELMDMEIVAADIGSAYIQAMTKEAVYTVAGPEFGKNEGCYMIVEKALYGFQTSGNAWHEKFADNLRSMKFKPSKADQDLWIRFDPVRGEYDMIAVFVDDILVFSKHPEDVIEPLKKEFKYELKGVGEPEYYNGADIHKNPETKCWEFSAKTYIKNICEKLEKLLDCTFKNYGSPMEVGDHPETDESDLLPPDYVSIYQMLIGCAQWAVIIGRFDIQYATISLARFAHMPREGHLG